LYLPEGRWCEYETGKVYDGGCTITVDAPLNRVPLFVKEGKTVFVK
jgi:alpha-glucosidase (family GH31 glycosyl hydrolase)